MNHFTSEKAKNNHFENCKNNKQNRICMPENEKDKIVKFRNYKNKLKCPFVVYEDFEAIAVDIDKDKQIHQVCSYAAAVVSQYDNLIKLYNERSTKKEHVTFYNNMIIYLYRGKDSDDLKRQYFEDMTDIQLSIIHAMKLNIEINMTEEDEINFNKETICHICEKELDENKVRDHDHFTGKYRGAAHYDCNINYNFKNFKIPVFFHNLKGYDEHFIIKAYAKYGKYMKQALDKDGNVIEKETTMRIDCIPNTSEKYLSFTIGRMQFKDSFGFMSSSLEQLVSNLFKGKGKEGFKYVKAAYEKYGNKWEMLLRKGIYPYEYMNSFERFNETKLPDIDKFFSKLNDETVKDDDYKYAQKVWNEFEIKNLGEYTDLYMLCDVLLLADVFEEFRSMAINDYQLDPANYLTAPSLFNDANYKLRNNEIENMTDIDMFIMFEKAKRGGLCTIGSDRYVEANNKYMKEYDKSKPSKYVIYIDANGLYSDAMSKPLPTNDFKWEDTKIFTDDYIKNIPDDGINGRGFIFEVDIEYPKELHNYFNDYIPLPENIAFESSPYMKEAATGMEIKSNKQIKLTCCLTNKNQYVVHYAELKSALNKGIKLKTIHRVISFKQSCWMKEYIMFNQNKRIQAKNEFEKDFYKLANNSVYGKTMENVRNRRDVKLTTDEKIKQKYANSGWYKDFKLFKDEGETEGLYAVEMAKKKVVMNKPIAIGVSVLAWSKVRMFDFYYDVVKMKYNDKVKMHYTDTDSMFLSIQTDDLYNDIANDLKFANNFDFSNYSNDHPLFNNFGNKEELINIKNNNKGVFGKFKDEAGGKIINECCFIRAKMYSYIKEGEAETEKTKRAKGVKKSSIKYITHQKYKNCLLSENKEDRLLDTDFYRIASKQHQLMTIHQKKTSLSHYDDKRYYLNNIESRAHGHYLNSPINW